MFLAKINKEQFLEAVKTIDTVILPIGSLEAHGCHCPLSTDIIVPEKIAAMLDEQVGDKLLIAPAVAYGYSPSLIYFPGTVSVSGETLANYVTEIVSCWTNVGIKNVILLNGHGGNVPSLTIAANRIAKTGAKVMLVNWWLHFSKEILTVCDGQGHAGEDETSVVLALDPTLVDMSKAKVYEKKLMITMMADDIVKYSYPDAMNGDATKATAAKGEAIYQMVVRRLGTLLERLWQDQIID